MIDNILANFPTYMMAGIVGVVVISQLNRMLGSVLGTGFWICVAFLGNAVYERGGQIGLPSWPFPKPVFFGLCAAFMALNGASIYATLSKRKRMKQRQAMLQFDPADEAPGADEEFRSDEPVS